MSRRHPNNYSAGSGDEGVDGVTCNCKDDWCSCSNTIDKVASHLTEKVVCYQCQSGNHTYNR